MRIAIERPKETPSGNMIATQHEERSPARDPSTTVAPQANIARAEHDTDTTVERVVETSPRADRLQRAFGRSDASTGETPIDEMELPVIQGLAVANGERDLQRSARHSDGAAGSAEQAIVAAASSPSSPLPDSLMRRFESSLGSDLSGVRVHTGLASEQAARALEAKAYTVGRDIYFGAGYYEPATSHGQHLLAHEVVHTVQQSSAAPRIQHKLAVSASGDPEELEADHAADAMLAGGSSTVAHQVSGSTVQRQVAAASGRREDPASQRTVRGLGGYVYCQYADGSITIVGGPTSVGLTFKLGTKTNKAITDEIGPFPVSPHAAAAGQPSRSAGLAERLGNVVEETRTAVAHGIERAERAVIDVAREAELFAGGVSDTLAGLYRRGVGPPSQEKPKAGTKESEEATRAGGPPALIGDVRRCVSADARLRDENNLPLTPRKVVPLGAYVRILETRDGLVRVAQIAKLDITEGTELGWTRASNLAAVIRPARPSSPSTQMAQLLATAASQHGAMGGYCYRAIKHYIKNAGGYGDILDIYQDERFEGYGAAAVDFAAAVDAHGPRALGLEKVSGLPADATPGTLLVTRGNGKIHLSREYGDIAVIAGVEQGCVICYNDGRMKLVARADAWTSGDYVGVLVGMYRPIARP
ncbi:MAG TPA: DUF4157 domain-containing protein [Kofleriaceae bacterium]|nr:DUF4157 domain-containing protein [Kofleriaceae bacterium]